MHAHLPGAMSQHLETVLKLNTKHRVREWFDHGALKDDRVLFSFRQFILLQITLIDIAQTRQNLTTTAVMSRPTGHGAQKATLLV